MAQPDALRLGSLCTGYGGLDMAAQQTFGGSLAWVADNDPGASRILAHRYQVPNLGDLTAIDWTTVASVDIVTGGYPCQPFSSAGKRKGTKDARHIWPDIARALGVLRPRLAVFENVAGHLSLGFDTVLADLAALGFDAEWRCVRASDIGAAHQRNRLFILAWPADTGGQGLARRWAEGTASQRRHLPAADPVDLGEHRARTRGPGRDESAARRFAAADTARVGEREPADEAHAVAGSRDARQVPRCGSGEPADLGVDFGEYGPAVARWESALGRPAPRPTDALGRLNPPFVEWLMGLPSGHVTDVPGLSRSAQLKALGNGVMPQQAVHALRLLLATASADDSPPPRRTPPRAAPVSPKPGPPLFTSALQGTGDTQHDP
ncbi:DNA cytosine methyltransferase [Streptomyces sp. NBC_00582]|uniref:DNA cytosine methyltransferase n=1 Tax=Streptomyces sp. NBC_00582 TaxID=2975783 RepID=UPI002E81BC65|nr:DNA cytosine methyltransferase [Streptomyces sp. NBC_00582]WUB64040.1 DNA cytosine methyltransferase [Streptomyces sp. NBC_00582]